MKKSDYNIEVLRSVSCFFVIMVHAANCFCRSFDNISTFSYGAAAFYNIIARTSVPVFFMISGALLLGKNYPLKTYFKKLRYFLGVLIFASTFYYFWNTLYLHKTVYLNNILSEPTEKHLWYMYAYIGIMIILPFLQRIFSQNNREIENLFAVLWVLFMLVNRIIYFFGLKFGYDVPLVSTPYYLGYFIIGYIIKRRIDEIKIKKFFLTVLIVLSVTASLIYTLNASLKVYNRHYDVYFQYRDVFIALSSICIYALILKTKTKNIKIGKADIFEFVGKHSFVIYIMHPVFLDLLKKTTHYLEYPAIITVPIMSAVILVLTLMLAVIYGFIKDKFFFFIEKSRQKSTKNE